MWDQIYYNCTTRSVRRRLESRTALRLFLVLIALAILLVQRRIQHYHSRIHSPPTAEIPPVQHQVPIPEKRNEVPPRRIRRSPSLFNRRKATPILIFVPNRIQQKVKKNYTAGTKKAIGSLWSTLCWILCRVPSRTWERLV